MAGQRHIAWFAASLVPAVFALLVFGSTVRAHGAGLACPDWPLCFGEVVPRLDFGVFLEWGHRVFASVVSLGWLVLGAWLFRSGAPRGVRALWVGGLLLLGVQVVLGGLTVLHLLAEWTVVGHLLGGNSFMALAFVTALLLRDQAAPMTRDPIGPGQRAWASRFAGLLLAQLALGGLVSSSGAGLACGTWPGCNGPEWFPTFQGLIGLQVLHRITAYTVLAFAVATVVSTGARGRTGRASLVILGLVLAQVAIGVANVLTGIAVEVTVAHAGGAAALVLATTWLNYEAWRAPVGHVVRRADLVPAEAT